MQWFWSRFSRTLTGLLHSLGARHESKHTLLRQVMLVRLHSIPERDTVSLSGGESIIHCRGTRIVFHDYYLFRSMVHKYLNLSCFFQALNEAKLKALYHDLKTQDKQEIAFKKIKAQGKDKDGLQEAALRTQLAGIVERFGLAASFPEHKTNADDEHKIDLMFKDKKLNKLWKKVQILDSLLCCDDLQGVPLP